MVTVVEYFMEATSDKNLSFVEEFYNHLQEEAFEKPLIEADFCEGLPLNAR